MKQTVLILPNELRLSEFSASGSLGIKRVAIRKAWYDVGHLNRLVVTIGLIIAPGRVNYK